MPSVSEAVEWTPDPAPASTPKVKRTRLKNISFEKHSIEDIFDIPEPAVVPWEIFGPYFPQYNKMDYEFVSPKTLVGLEIEVENVMNIGPNVQRCYWVAKEDGSLRNHGVEFVTPGVIPVSATPIALNLLVAELNKDIDFSRRTSVHVHLDVRQLTLSQLMGLLFTYIVCENLFFKFVANHRRNNIFCVPLTETGLVSNLRKNPKEILLAIGNYWAKYSALNLLPLQKFGSLEFRHMPGTLNISKLMIWLDLISCLKVFTYKNDLKDIVKNIMSLNSNSRYRQFVESVFADRCIHLDMSNLLYDMEKAVYLVKHCGAINEFDNFIRTHADLIDSQLGQKLNTWMRKLSEEQIRALKLLHALSVSLGHGKDMQWVFRSVIKEPHYWMQFDPQYQDAVNILLKSKVLTPKPKEEKKLLTPEETILIAGNTYTYTIGTQ